MDTALGLPPVGNCELLEQRALVCLIQAESLGGYLEAEPGRFHAFYLVVNGAAAQNIDDALKVFDDLADVSAILQEDGAKQEETTSRVDEQ